MPYIIIHDNVLCNSYSIRPNLQLDDISDRLQSGIIYETQCLARDGQSSINEGKFQK